MSAASGPPVTSWRKTMAAGLASITESRPPGRTEAARRRTSSASAGR
ncbi:hypothetical protein ACIA03_16925 [Nocardioides sp. NPDC051685]